MNKKKQIKKTNQRILANTGAGKELQVIFKCSADCVSKALNFHTNSLKAEAIREYAIDHFKGKKITIPGKSRKSRKSTKKQKKS